MKWMVTLFAVVMLMMMDQSWYRGYYTDQTARALAMVIR